MHHKKTTLRAALVAVIAGLLATASTAVADAEVESGVSMAATASFSASATDCENNPGPYVTLSGAIVLGDMEVELIFRNNDKGTHEHTEDTTVSAVMELEDGSITIPKQPALGGTGGNPFIWVQFLEADGNELTDEIFLGRCVQGLDSDVVADFFIPSDATIGVSGDQCENNPGPYITLSGELSLTGVDARIIFRNNDNPVGGPHKATEETSVDLEIIPDGETIRFNKQPVLGGVGGNPKVWLSFETADGTTEEFYLGRCVQDL